MKAELKERDLIGLTLRLLNASGIPAWRQNAGLSLIQAGARRRVIRIGLKGMPDIIGIIPPQGRFLAVEVKSGRASLTPHQKAFLQAIGEAGGYCAVVREPRDVDRLLLELKKLTRTPSPSLSRPPQPNSLPQIEPPI